MFLMKCDERDVRLKAFFVGAKGENSQSYKERMDDVLERWLNWRRSFYTEEGAAISLQDKESSSFIDAQQVTKNVLLQLMSIYEDENKFFSPHYLGHMLSECTLPAMLGHYIALIHNPNNISQDASAAGVKIEKESVDMLKNLVHYPLSSKGHFTSGGTIANLEAFYRAVEVYRKKHGHDLKNFHVFLPKSAHYSWQKCLKIFGVLPNQTHYIELDDEFRMDLRSLAKTLEKLGEALMGGLLVCVAATTELGAVDPIGDVAELLKLNGLREKLWFHVDAAYGAFFLCCEKNLRTESWYDQLHSGVKQSDSITLDPHKLGYVPYSAGVFLVRNPEHYSLFSPAAAYVEDGPEWPGASTLEGSRPATGATAFWASAKSIGLDAEGYGRLLDLTLKQKNEFVSMLKGDEAIYCLKGCHTNLVGLIFKDLKQMSTLASNQLVLGLLKHCREGRFPYKFSTTRFNFSEYPNFEKQLLREGYVIDTPYADVLRIVFMNPFVGSKEFKQSHIQSLYTEIKGYLKHDLSHTVQV